MELLKYDHPSKTVKIKSMYKSAKVLLRELVLINDGHPQVIWGKRLLQVMLIQESGRDN